MSADQAGAGDLPTPSVRSLVALLVLVAIAAGVGVALFLGTPAAERPDVWAALRVAWPAIVVMVPACLGYIGIRRVGAETARQSITLSTIHRNTNGVLDQRIRDGVRAVLTEHLPTVADVAKAAEHTAAVLAAEQAATDHADVALVDVVPDDSPTD